MPRYTGLKPTSTLTVAIASGTRIAVPYADIEKTYGCHYILGRPVFVAAFGIVRATRRLTPPQLAGAPLPVGRPRFSSRDVLKVYLTQSEFTEYVIEHTAVTLAGLAFNQQLPKAVESSAALARTPPRTRSAAIPIPNAPRKPLTFSYAMRAGAYEALDAY